MVSRFPSTSSLILEDVPAFVHGEAERLLFDLETGGGTYDHVARALHWFEMELDAFRFHEEDDNNEFQPHWRLEEGVNVFLKSRTAATNNEEA